LLLPLKALIPEEVALLDYEAAVHIMHVEDLTVRSPSPAGGRGRDQDAGGTEGAGSGGGGAGADPRGPLGPTRGAGVDPGRETPSHQWRGGAGSGHHCGAVGPHYRCHGGVSGAARCYRLSEGLGSGQWWIWKRVGR
jgi:hypothetical protein